MAKEKSPERDSVVQPIAACHAAAFAFEMLSHWGQIYPNHASDGFSFPPTFPGIVRADPLRSVDITAPSRETNPQRNVTVVLNLLSDFGPEDQDRIARFQSLLRKVAADEKIEIIEARMGSLRVSYQIQTNHSLLLVPINCERRSPNGMALSYWVSLP